MRLYNPVDRDLAVKYDGAEHVLTANEVTEVPDPVGQHAKRKLAFLGVRALNGFPSNDERVKKEAETAHTGYLLRRAREAGIVPVSAHPDAAELRAALEKRGLLEV